MEASGHGSQPGCQQGGQVGLAAVTHRLCGLEVARRGFAPAQDVVRVGQLDSGCRQETFLLDGAGRPERRRGVQRRVRSGGCPEQFTGGDVGAGIKGPAQLVQEGVRVHCAGKRKGPEARPEAGAPARRDTAAHDFTDQRARGPDNAVTVPRDGDDAGHLQRVDRTGAAEPEDLAERQRSCKGDNRGGGLLFRRHGAELVVQQVRGRDGTQVRR